MVIKQKWVAGKQAPETRVLNYPHFPPYTFRLPGHKYNMPIMVTLSELKFTKKLKIACSIFCEATVSQLIFRQRLLEIPFASTENWWLGRTVYFSWCLSGINNKKIGGQFLVVLKFSSGQLDSFCPSPGLVLGLWSWRRESWNYGVR